MLPSAPFSVSAVPANGTVIQPGGSVGIPIVFTPDIVGNSLSTLTIQTNDGNVTLNLTGGTGYPPSLEVGPQTIDFGSVPVGVTETRSFTITNTGSTATAVTLSKPPVTSAGFAAVTSLPEDTTIAAGASLTETVSFTPPTTGAATDGWILDSTDGLGKRTVTFVGTGVSPPQPAVSVASLNTYWPLPGTTGTANFIVSLSWPSTTPVTVTANTVDGTATAGGGDYIALTNDTVTIPAGSTTATVPVTIEPNGGKHNTPIVFNLVLSNPVGAFAGNVTGQGNILHGGNAANEFMTAVSTMVTQSLVSSQTAEVPVTLVGDNYAANCIVNTADGTATAASGAYVPISNGIVTFKAGQPRVTIPVTIPAGAQPTGNETFTVNLSDCNPGAVPAGPTATVTIIGASASGASLEVAPSTLDFGSVAMGVTETRSFTVTNTGGSPDTVSTSAPPSDGEGFAESSGLSSGSVIAPGQTLTETVTFTPTAQGPRSDNWTIAGNDGLGLQTVSFIGTGLEPLTPTLSVNWLNVVRPTTGTTTATFTLSLSEPSPGPASVTVRTRDGTCTAASGAYLPIAGQLVTFAPGQTTASVPVTVNGSTATHCYFGLQLVVPYSGVVITDDYGRVNVLRPSDAAHDLVSAGTAAVVQTSTVAQTAELPITSNAHTDTITCGVSTADGTAVAASGDYTAIVNGTVTLNPGQTVTFVPIIIPPGTSLQPNRTFTVTLGNCSSNVSIADPTGTVTINAVPSLQAPTIVSQPVNTTVTSGQTATLTAVATGSPNPTVQWMTRPPGQPPSSLYQVRIPRPTHSRPLISRTALSSKPPSPMRSGPSPPRRRH